jgi:hypothetical protein
MPDYIPGKPSMVPKNLPGAGSAKAAQRGSSDAHIVHRLARHIPVAAAKAVSAVAIAVWAASCTAAA